MLRRKKLTLIYVWTIFIFGYAQTNQERSSLRINQPQTLAKEFPNGVTETPAMFGIPSYSHGSSITGILVYPQPQDLEGCYAIDKSHSRTPWPTEGIVIVIVDRGNCTFVTKIRHCEQVGANAAIIIDNIDEDRIPYMADDGSGGSLTIPSMLIRKKDGLKIKNAMAKGSVVVTLSWNLNHPDNVVEWEFWTSANDDVGLGFKKSFKQAIEALGNQQAFTPRYFLRNGKYSGCTDQSLPCGSQCTNNGRYCAVDPEHDYDIGLDGAHVVRENLRQICLFQYLNSTGNTLKWWDYTVQFDTICGEQNEKSWTPSCSRTIMTQLGIDPEPVFKCVKDSGGSDMLGGENTLLKAALDLKLNRGIFFLPTIIINDIHYRGSLSCPPPIDIAHCGVLSTICAGYKDDTEPDACRSSPGCDVGVARDDCGVCGGNGTYDGCGQCLDPNDPKFKAKGKFDPCGECKNIDDEDWGHGCAGCDGVANSGKKVDECGVCAGPGRDACGSCVELGNAARVPPGEGGWDSCNKCLRFDSPSFNNTCLDCAGVPNGLKKKDNCGECDGPGKDVCDRCLPIGSTSRMSKDDGGLDRCGRCLKFDDPLWNTTCVAASNGNNTHTPIYVIIMIIVGTLAIAGIVVFFVMRERERRMKRDIDSLLKQYLPLDTTNQPLSLNDDFSTVGENSSMMTT